jgi:predicted AAA+ superfamily ATPase
MRQISREQVKRKIALLNPHWVKGGIDNDVNILKRRKYFDLFFPLITSKVQRAVVLMGPRRVGKTVLLLQTIQELIEKDIEPKKLLFISIDIPILHPFSLEDLLELYQEIFSIGDLKGKVIFFDEIQYLKDWDIQLKVLVDTYKETKFIASGSAAGALKRKSFESGAGRFTDFLLPPLTFYEYLDLLGLTDSLIEFKGPNEFPLAKNIEELNRQFINYLNYGGFPEAIFNEEIQKDPQRFIRSDIIDKVLLRDLPSLYGIQDTQELNRLFTALAYQTGSEITYEALSQSSGVAKNTIKKYIEYLEAAFLIRTIKRVDDTGQRFKRTNYLKVYLTNPSMYSAIYELASEDDPTTLGSLVETAIFCQWMHAPRDIGQIFYARWKGGKYEVDMVYMDQTLKIGWCLEVKWSDRYIDRPEDLKGLIKLCQRNNINKAGVTTKSKRAKLQYEGINLTFTESSIQCFTVGYNLIKYFKL